MMLVAAIIAYVVGGGLLLYAVLSAGRRADRKAGRVRKMMEETHGSPLDLATSTASSDG